MNTVVLLATDEGLLASLKRSFQREAPELEVVLADEPGAQRAEVAACWFPPAGSLARLPNLKLIHSVAAGIDHLQHDPQRPALPVCRVVDPGHRQGMTEYVRWAVIHYHRGFDQVLRQHREQQWQRPVQRAAASFKVGVMGLGSLGSAIASDLAGAGYTVRGWARTGKHLEKVTTYKGQEDFAAFLDGLDLLVNLLPLTDATRGILCRETFAALAPGAAIVNCGRGQHVLADDLAQALACGQLRGAMLDVFEKEPLAAEHPLWTLPGVIVTPHMASAASHDCIARQVAENVRRLSQGEPLLNTVSVALGY
ncbi:glyoxylate/hydroxypyruvate reductase A [Pseudomonas sp. R5(2019)]|uniref:2-hydroxyacid dehydrogenase n=1 Tax=Pseudomonas sp. R5(2019) TaxID=2697566 RepID=UPI001412B068|nr:glyoxylate/hydroxypyruvate reductase A [Pseudomonas sp. R5(2019)]NBA95889.1 glyoxylate/hydroxypyruvate reductase A [Pseudomonas sp. R5(2019)]